MCILCPSAHSPFPDGVREQRAGDVFFPGLQHANECDFSWLSLTKPRIFWIQDLCAFLCQRTESNLLLKSPYTRHSFENNERGFSQLTSSSYALSTLAVAGDLLRLHTGCDTSEQELWQACLLRHPNSCDVPLTSRTLKPHLSSTTPALRQVITSTGTPA